MVLYTGLLRWIKHTLQKDNYISKYSAIKTFTCILENTYMIRISHDALHAVWKINW